MSNSDFVQTMSGKNVQRGKTLACETEGDDFIFDLVIWPMITLLVGLATYLAWPDILSFLYSSVCR